MEDDSSPRGFLRTRYTARFWLGPIQIQAWRDGFWLIAWNGRRWYFGRMAT